MQILTAFRKRRSRFRTAVDPGTILDLDCRDAAVVTGAFDGVGHVSFRGYAYQERCTVNVQGANC